VEGKTVNRYPVDAKLAIGDVPKFYRRKIEDFPGFPYIRPTPKAATKWATKMNEIFLDDKPVIALNWIGGHKKTRVEVRSMRLEQWLPILKLDAHFVSLQYTKCEDELDAFAREHGISIHHFAEAAYSDHYDEVAGVLANADLVITCCSSIVHLAGSMGVPTWVLTPSRPAWRYRLDLSHMPWYGKTVTLFRQGQGSVAWEPVIEEVAGALNNLLGDRNVGKAGPSGPETEREGAGAVVAGD
jgi:ADP-heptose:LPS heptosyltransferase